MRSRALPSSKASSADKADCITSPVRRGRVGSEDRRLRGNCAIGASLKGVRFCPHCRRGAGFPSFGLAPLHDARRHRYNKSFHLTGGPVTNLFSVDWSKIPAPTDDDAARHIVGSSIPSVQLWSTGGELIDLAHHSPFDGMVVVYAYPMTGRPDTPLPDGWDMIPGARGCTPQSCAFRDHFEDLRQLSVSHLFGLSTQTTAYQMEAAERLHLPFALLSDSDFKLTEALRLPTFETAGMRLLKRLTMIISQHRIEHVFYPVFPPDRNASDVIDWLRARMLKLSG